MPIYSADFVSSTNSLGWNTYGVTLSARRNRQFDEFSTTKLFIVRHIFRRGVRGCRHVAMELIDSYVRNFLQSGEGALIATFPGAIADDGNSGVQSPDERRIITIVNAMMVYLKNIDCSDEVFGTN